MAAYELVLLVAASLFQTEAPNVTKLRLGAFGLQPAEIGLVRAFVQMSASYSGDFPWIFTDKPPFDVVLVDADHPSSKESQIRKLASTVLHLTNDYHREAPNIMARPLRFSKFEAWLEHNATEIQKLRMLDSNLSSRGNLAPSSGANVRTRYKLRRWPPIAVLNQNPFHTRMAIILSKQAIGLTDLSNMMQISQEECLLSLNIFESFSLLDNQQIPSSSTGNVTTQDRRPLGLVASIRRRLGL